MMGDVVQLDSLLDGGIASIGVMMQSLNEIPIAMERSDVEGRESTDSLLSLVGVIYEA